MDCTFVKIPRSCFELEQFSRQPASKTHALCDLYYQAAFVDHEVDCHGVKKLLLRGQFWTTQRRLSERWGWSKTKVNNFLSTLEILGEVSQIKDKCIEKGGTVITMLKAVDSTMLEESVICKKTTERPQKDQEKTTKSPNIIKKNEELKTIAPVGATADAQRVSSAEYKEIAAHLTDNVGLSESLLKMAVNLLHKPADQWTPLSLGALYYAIDQHRREGKQISEDTIRLALGHMKGNTPSRQDFEDNYFKRAETQLKNIRIRLEQLT